MGYFLATEREDPILGTLPQRWDTIMAQIFANQNQDHHLPTEGNCVQDAQLCTTEEQRELEDAL